MTLEETLTWPFFDERHRGFAEALARFADTTLAELPHDDVDAACRARVKALGEAGFLKAVMPAEHGGLYDRLDVRTLCLAREILGSDVAALAATAKPDGASHLRIDGSKTWISNGGIADHYVVFARTGEGPGAKGLSAFVVDAAAPGLSVTERIEVIAPHPLATLRFEGVRVPVGNRLGGPGDGFKVAMATLDLFRSTVGAAALGFARRALHETVERAASRKLFGAPLAELQLTQAAIADSASEVDASALLVYRAAWTKDQGAARVTREAATAKMFATEAAQRVIDRAVRIGGGVAANVRWQ